MLSCLWKEDEKRKLLTFPQNSEESKNVVINCVYYEIEIPRSFMEQYTTSKYYLLQVEIYKLYQKRWCIDIQNNLEENLVNKI